jgi:hypothetical protein
MANLTSTPPPGVTQFAKLARRTLSFWGTLVDGGLADEAKMSDRPLLTKLGASNPDAVWESLSTVGVPRKIERERLRATVDPRTTSSEDTEPRAMTIG